MYTMSPPSGMATTRLPPWPWRLTNRDIDTTDSEDVSNSEDAAEGVGQLSLDENSEVSYDTIFSILYF